MRYRALFFDVFGTIVDWRSSIIEEGKELNLSKGWNIDWAQFADQWRSMYQPSMQKVRDGERQWIELDALHRESLEILIDQYQIQSLTHEEVDCLNRVWHRLAPWPDCVEGLTALKEKYILATMSNGNVGLLTHLAKYSALPWDVILGAGIAKQYKPLPEVYMNGCTTLSLHPSEVIMVAAHNGDLAVAKELGFATAFILRPLEHGPNQIEDKCAEGNWDYIATSLIELSSLLACE